MRPDVQRWFESRTFRVTPRPESLVARKAGQRVSVVLPALNEAATVGAIVSAVRRHYVERVPLVDEIVVIDPGSTDATARVAEAAGAVVVPGRYVLPGYGSSRGKGEALWKSLFITDGDLLAFLDADLREFDPSYVPRLLAPLLIDPSVALVKGFYDRPLHAQGSPARTGGGGRVTELVARPLIALHWPALSGVVQPLAGEYAARRDLLEQLPFVTGYGVELALLIDTLRTSGLEAVAQVDLGRRVHRNQDDAALGRMAAALQLTALSRLGRPAPANLALTQYVRTAKGAVEPATSTVDVAERPPMVTVPEYATRQAAAS
ncbi:MAG: glucosyl-3-phosphoglycerate synthase [Frankiaceae bacterium]